jgi:predicted phage terminase large subunit-like protein
MGEHHVLRPQPGPQEAFLASPADIAIYGGAAGGGKTYAMVLETLRHKDVPGFYSVFFRRTMPQIHNPGALWDTARKVYPLAGAIPKEQPSEWHWPESGARAKMAHLEHESTVEDWQGSQVPLFLFDELTHFTEYMFFYMLSRNRSECGVRPYMRATCNPDPDSWVAKLIEWWIDQDSGFPIAERSGKLRWFVRVNDSLVWGDSRDEVLAKNPSSSIGDVKSLTFIPAKLEDNKILETADPGYRGNLNAMTRVMRERLLGGNWKARPVAGKVFPKDAVSYLDGPPGDVVDVIRAWDLAATEPSETNKDPDYTCGVKIGRRKNGRYVVLDVEHCRKKSHKVHEKVEKTAERDGRQMRVFLPQDPAQAGKDQAAGYIRDLAGYRVKCERETGDKATRADALACQWQAKNVDVVRAPWNDWYLALMDAFPTTGVHDDPVDASASGFNRIAKGISIFDVVT